MEWLVHMQKWWESLEDRRRFPRNPGGGIVAHYWTGGPPAPRKVSNVSVDGAYIQAPDTWYPGTIITLTFQPISEPAAGPAGNDGSRSSPDVRAVVVRSGGDGFGVRFLFVNHHEKVAFQRFLREVAAPEQAHVENRTRAQGGQALIEFALLLPLLFLLIVNVVNFGAFFFAWITVANAARAGSDYWIMGAATLNGPQTPSPTQVTNLIYNAGTGDASSLLNRASLQVQVCTNNNGTTACTGSAPAAWSGVAPAADPEAPLYVSGSVDVTYTFKPLIGGWSFPKLGIYLTLPPRIIHRRAVMRVMN